MITESFGGQGRALYSFFHRVKVLKNSKKSELTHTII